MADAVPNNLPLQLSSFIGRGREIAEVTRLLAASRLVTLTGAGGSGKTRLALEVAAALCRDGPPGRLPAEHLPPERQYPDGVWFVDLAPLSDPALVAGRIAAVLGVTEQTGRPLLESLVAALQSRQLLLILDNCEHLITTCAQVSETLLQACAGLTLLATSREPLNIAGETTLIVPSLSLPDSARPAFADTLNRSEAMHLFVERAASTRPAFALTLHNTIAVAEICRQLDGMPLAIELAAACVSTMSVEQIAVRLGDRFHLLTRGRRTALPRQQTLRGAIDWGYGLLSEPEQRLLGRLSVFAGGWTLDAAEAVAGLTPIATADVLGLMTSLVNKSLIHLETEADEPRYRCLATVREYAHEKLLEAGEADAIRDRHLAWYLNFAEGADPQLRCAQQVVWMKRLTREQDNLAVALEWSLADGRGMPSAPERTRSGVRLAGALRHYWNMRGDYGYGRFWLERALEHSGPIGDSLSDARLLVGMGILAVLQGDFAFAEARFNQCITLCAGIGENDFQAYASSWLANVRMEQGAFAEAMPLAERGLALRRTVNQRWGIGQALFVPGRAHLVLDELALARASYEESIAIFREIGDRFYLGFLLGHLGFIAVRQGKYEAARAYFLERLSIGQELGSNLLTVSARANLSDVALKQGNFHEAALLLGESLSELHNMDAKRDIVYRLEGVARMAAVARKPLEAARLLGAVEVLHAEMGSRAAEPRERADVEAALAAIQQQLDASAIQQARLQGRTLTLKQTLAEAQQILESIQSQPNSPMPESDFAADLTTRELEVLRLVAQGLTDPQIAEQLIISTRTVNAHLRSIYGKLDVTTRTAASRVALENKLI